MAVELQEEIELVKNYIALRKETNPNTIHIEWEIAEQVPLQTLIPSMSIQIPVENALKYAFEDNDEQTNTLSIHISKKTGIFPYISGIMVADMIRESIPTQNEAPETD